MSVQDIFDVMVQTVSLGLDASPTKQLPKIDQLITAEELVEALQCRPNPPNLTKSGPFLYRR